MTPTDRLLLESMVEVGDVEEVWRWVEEKIREAHPVAAPVQHAAAQPTFKVTGTVTLAQGRNRGTYNLIEPI